MRLSKSVSLIRTFEKLVCPLVPESLDSEKCTVFTNFINNPHSTEHEDLTELMIKILIPAKFRFRIPYLLHSSQLQCKFWIAAMNFGGVSPESNVAKR